MIQLLDPTSQELEYNDLNESVKPNPHSLKRQRVPVKALFIQIFYMN